MTPTQLEDFARAQFNATGDTFYTQAEIFRHIFQAQMELAKKAQCIRRSYTTSTVAGTQEYARPANAFGIKRIEYNGTKLTPATMREDDAITAMNRTTTAQGTPQFYFVWGTSIYLRPVPDAVGTLTLFTYDKPQEVSVATTLDVPDDYHHLIGSTYVVAFMALKDRNPPLYSEYKALWDQGLKDAIVAEKLSLRADSFVGVQDSATLNETVIGAM